MSMDEMSKNVSIEIHNEGNESENSEKTTVTKLCSNW